MEEAFRWLQSELGYLFVDDPHPSFHGITLEYKTSTSRASVLASIIGRTTEALLAPADREIGWGVSHNAFMFVRGWPNPGRVLDVGSVEGAIESVRRQSEALRSLRETELAGDYSHYDRAFNAMRARIPDYATGS